VEHVPHERFGDVPIARDPDEQGEDDSMRSRVQRVQRGPVATGGGPDEAGPLFLGDASLRSIGVEQITQPRRHQVVDRGQQGIMERPLAHEHVRAAVRGHESVGGLGERADEDDPRLRQLPPDMCGQIDAVEAGHHQVGDHEVWPVESHKAERFLTIFMSDARARR
jgi:hypothetical protein